MATSKQFPTLVQLGQQDQQFEELSYLDKRPFWFNAEHLMNPYRVYLEAWLVEAIFGPGGEHIPHVECVSQTILRVRRVDPEGKAEILIFGRPYYQKDIAKIITNLADYHRQRREQKKSLAPEAGTQGAADADPEAGTQEAADADPEAGTQEAADADPEAGTQEAADADPEAGTPGAADAIRRPAPRGLRTPIRRPAPRGLRTPIRRPAPRGLRTLPSSGLPSFEGS
nr:KHDC3-like protein [Loxodonta africana]